MEQSLLYVRLSSWNRALVGSTSEFVAQFMEENPSPAATSHQASQVILLLRMWISK